MNGEASVIVSWHLKNKVQRKPVTTRPIIQVALKTLQRETAQTNHTPALFSQHLYDKGTRQRVPF